MAPLILLLRAWVERAWSRNSEGQIGLRSVETRFGFVPLKPVDLYIPEGVRPADHGKVHQSLLKASDYFTSRELMILYAVTDAVILLLQDWPQWSLWQHGTIPRTAMSELDARLAHI